MEYKVINNNTTATMDISAPRKGRYIMLPLKPSRASIGKPHTAQPLETIANNELPPTIMCNFPLPRITNNRKISRVRVIPVKLPVSTSRNKENLVIAVHMPPSKAISRLNLYDSGKFPITVSFTKLKFIKYTAKIIYMTAMPALNPRNFLDNKISLIHFMDYFNCWSITVLKAA